MSVFVDTSAFLAVLDGTDTNHQQAKGEWERLISLDEVLVCSNYILVETVAVSQRKLGLEAVRSFHQDVFPLLRIQWVDKSIHETAITSMFVAGRRHLSLVDCASFEIMRRLGITKVFCFDVHFEEQGFETIGSGGR